MEDQAYREARPAPSPSPSLLRTAHRLPVAQAPPRWPVVELDSHWTAPVSPSSLPPGPGFTPIPLLPFSSALTLQDPGLAQASCSVIGSHDQCFPWACTAPDSGWRMQLGGGFHSMVTSGAPALSQCDNSLRSFCLCYRQALGHWGRGADHSGRLEVCHLPASWPESVYPGPWLSDPQEKRIKLKRCCSLFDLYEMNHFPTIRKAEQLAHITGVIRLTPME